MRPTSVFLRMLCILCLIIFAGISHAGTPWEDAWATLSEPDIPAMINKMEEAADDPASAQDARLVLTLLYTAIEEYEKAGRHFRDYYEAAGDPIPAAYALWFKEGVTGVAGSRRTEQQLKMLETIAVDPRNMGRLDAAVYYWIGMHYLLSNDKKNLRKTYEQIDRIDEWSLCGPFDNVMNSGYDKDFGPPEHPENEAVFTSRYGAEVGWYDPEFETGDPYFIKETYFLSSSSIIYAQNFVKSPVEQEVILKFGYSGTLKLWLNDELIYRDPATRETEMDHFQYRVRLNKGYNRLLVQLGDYDVSTPTFCIRLTDTDHQPMESLEVSTRSQPYAKGEAEAEALPPFAESWWEAQVAAHPDNVLYKLMLSRTYDRASDFDKAEAVLKEALELAPDNYLVLRAAIFHYNDADNATEQNRFYEIHRTRFPYDQDILSNEIDEAVDDEEKEKARELIREYMNRYPGEYARIQYDLLLAGFDEDHEAIVRLANEWYSKFPEDYSAMSTKYQVEKSMRSDMSSAMKVLTKFLEHTYNYSVISELASIHQEAGDNNKAIDMLEKSLDMVPYDMNTYQQIINLQARQLLFHDALEQCRFIVDTRPSDYETLGDMGLLYNIMNKKGDAVNYYQRSLDFLPFNFDTNERMRELKEELPMLELIRKPEPDDLIDEYREQFVSKGRHSYDVVADVKNYIVYKSPSIATHRTYIIKMNDESAIEEWQHLNFSPDRLNTMVINEAKTIKADGNKIEAEQSGYDVVFTNLEPGDFIYVEYTEKQMGGGKSSMFVSDNFNFDRYSPAHRLEYHLWVEEGQAIGTQLDNSDIQPVVDTVAGFVHYFWEKLDPETVDEEIMSVPFSDIAQRLHIHLDAGWDDIVQWYSDLSGHQARADFTIRQLAAELIGDRDLTDIEKAKIIYDFVCKNIQYSSIDFRQSGYIPQRASKVYHTRLGDCKDVSTLYAAIAREVGLKVRLVLINTSDNGHREVVLPSLNFNHCIVKVDLASGPMFLELTDPDLPFGHLYYYHKGAAILEIPFEEKVSGTGLTYLDFNPGYINEVLRKTVVHVGSDREVRVDMEVVKTGTNAANAVKGMYDADDEDRLDGIRQSANALFEAPASVDTLIIRHLEPLSDTAAYDYTYRVRKGTQSIGSFTSLKVPFHDVLAELQLFEEKERKYTFDFVYYENTERYVQELTIYSSDDLSLLEMPESVEYSFRGSTYRLTCRKNDDGSVFIRREYEVERENIQPEDFKAFEEFVNGIVEAENSHVIFQ